MTRLTYEPSPRARDLAKLIISLEPESHIVIYPHVRADGDSYGSSLALALVLDALGHEPRVYLEEARTEQNLIFDLAPYEFVVGEGPKDPETSTDPKISASLARSQSSDSFTHQGFPQDLAWMIDCSELSRLGRRRTAWETCPRQVVTDHHESAWLDRGSVWIDTSEPAVASLIFDLIYVLEDILGQDFFNLEVASALFAALLTDTGRFTYSKVSAKTFMQAAILKSYDVNQEALVEHFFETQRLPRLLAHAEIARTLKLSEDGTFAFAYLDQAFQSKAHSDDTDFQGLVAWLRQLQGCHLCVLMTEDAEVQDLWRGSVRSDALAEARGLAEQFGGGGHAQAAGFTVEDQKIESIEATCFASYKKYMKDLKSGQREGA